MPAGNQVLDESHRFRESPLRGGIHEPRVPGGPTYLPLRIRTSWSRSPRIPRGLVTPVPTRHSGQHQEVAASWRTIQPFSGHMNASNAVGQPLRPSTAGCRSPQPTRPMATGAHVPHGHWLHWVAPRAVLRGCLPPGHHACLVTAGISPRLRAPLGDKGQGRGVPVTVRTQTASVGVPP